MVLPLHEVYYQLYAMSKMCKPNSNCNL